MSEKPEAMHGYGPVQGPGPGVGPAQGPGYRPGYPPYPYPYPYPYYFYPYPFLFRIPPRYFTGFYPRRRRRYGMDATQEWEEGTCIRCISEAEYASMQQLGIPEIEVME